MSLAPPIAEFTSPGGRAFTVDPGEHSERYPGDPLWSDGWPILLDGKRAGTLYRNLNYGTAADGSPRWTATTRQLFWSCRPEPPTGLGFDVAAFDTATECLAAWAVSADQILDWDEGIRDPLRERQDLLSRTRTYRAEQSRAEYPQRREKRRERSSEQRATGSIGACRCGACGEQGHNRRACPKAR